MSNDQLDVRQLLPKLKATNDQFDSGGLLTQELSESQNLPEGIPSLQAGAYLPLSPQLRARYEFAGSWKYAHAGQTWLSPVEMLQVLASPNVQRQMLLRKEDWPDCVLNKHPLHLLGLFGIDREEYEETYLVWSGVADAEPRIVQYIGYEEKSFDDLRSYLQYLVA